MMKNFKAIFVALAGALLLVSSASAQVEIYAVGSVFNENTPTLTDPVLGSRVVGMFGATNLYMINPNTGQPTLIGPTGFYSCQGLDIHPLTDELYAVCNEPLMDVIFNGDTTTNTEINGGQMLVRLDRNTGQGTEIGLLGGNIGVPFRGPFASDISFHPDGTLFVHINALDDTVGDLSDTDTKFDGDILQNSLGTIDLQTGEFHLIGATNEWDFYSAIGFSNAQNLFQCANLRDEPFNSVVNFNRLSQEIGSATFIQQLNLPETPFANVTVISSKDIDTESSIFYGLFLVDEVRELEELAPLAKTNNIDQEGSYLIRLNSFNGNIQVVGLIEGGQEAYLGIAVKSLPRNVPTMSEYGLMATAVLLLGAAAIYLRRRQSKLQA